LGAGFNQPIRAETASQNLAHAHLLQINFTYVLQCLHHIFPLYLFKKHTAYHSNWIRLNCPINSYILRCGM
jgi:hypothetical protein